MGRKRIVLLLSLVILVSAFLIIGVSLLTTPKQPTSSISNADVLNIGIEYVEETYGTDYARNGDVTEITYSNGTGNWTYPSASFRVPADLQQPGIIVNVMVNPQTGEIFKVLTNWSKSMPP